MNRITKTEHHTHLHCKLPLGHFIFYFLPAVDCAIASTMSCMAGDANIYSTVRLVLLVSCMTNTSSKHTEQNPVCTKVAGCVVLAQHLTQKKNVLSNNMGLCCTRTNILQIAKSRKPKKQ